MKSFMNNFCKIITDERVVVALGVLALAVLESATSSDSEHTGQKELEM